MRVLVIGRGSRGRVWERLIVRRRDTRLAGTVDPDPQADATWSAISEDALADADAAIIASPPALHGEHALACLAAGLAVLVEKPLALTIDDARAVSAAARATRRPVLVGQSFAERPLERAVETALASMGPLRAGMFVSSRAHSVTSAHLAGLEHAALWDFAVHHFDLIRRRAGAPPQAVESHRRGDTYRASFRWESGLEVGWWHDDGGELFHRAEWWRAEGGAVEVRDRSAWAVLERRRPRRLRLPRGTAENRLLDALVAGRSNAEQNLGTVAMVAATEAAIEAGPVVELAAVPGYD
jgi:predicted dehydrogenase